jgi:hypothetical protein
MEETLTLTRLGIRGQLKRTLASTNPYESMIEIVRRTQRKRERLVVGREGTALDRRRHARSRTAVSSRHRLPRPRQARCRDRARPRPSPSVRSSSHADPGGRYRRSRLTDHTGTAVTKIHGDRDILPATASRPAAISRRSAQFSTPGCRWYQRSTGLISTARMASNPRRFNSATRWPPMNPPAPVTTTSFQRQPQPSRSRSAEERTHVS